MPGGRPTTYNDELSDTICERLADGESLNAICKDSSMPAKGTVYNWLANPNLSEFLDKYTQARERQAETFIDECVDIADNTASDTIVKKSKSGEEFEAPNHEWITRSRLRVDTRIKIAEKLAPRKYTPRKALEHSGKISTSDLTEEQLDARIKVIEGKLSDQ